MDYRKKNICILIHKFKKKRVSCIYDCFENYRTDFSKFPKYKYIKHL